SSAWWRLFLLRRKSQLDRVPVESFRHLPTARVAIERRRIDPRQRALHEERDADRDHHRGERSDDEVDVLRHECADHEDATRENHSENDEGEGESKARLSDDVLAPGLL